MSREVELAEATARGAVRLFLGKIVSRGIGLIGSLVLIRLLKPEEYGLLSIALVAPGIFVLFLRVFGVNEAVTKHLAEYRSRDEFNNLKSFIYSGFIFALVLCSVLTVLCFIVAEAFASVMLGKSYVAHLIQVASLLILGWMLYGLSESILLGLESTRSYAVLMVLYESLMEILPIVLVIYGMGVLGALIGTVIATIVSGLVGILTSVWITVKMAHGSRATISLRLAFRKMLVYGIPLGAAVLIGFGLAQFYSFMIATYCNPYDIGNYQAADKLNTVMTYLSFPVSAVLFPAFSKINHAEEPRALKRMFNYSVKYSSFIVLPVAILVITLSHPLTTLVFGGRYENSWIYLTLLAINWLTYGLGQTHLWKLLSAQGEAKFIFLIDALTTTIGICLSILLIPSYGVLGLILTSFIVNWPSYIVAFRKAHKKYGIRFPLSGVWRIYILLAITVLVLVPATITSINEALKLVIGTLVGVTTYIVVAPIIGAIKEGDINNLRGILEPEPIIGLIASKVLKIMEKIAKFRT